MTNKSKIFFSIAIASLSHTKIYKTIKNLEKLKTKPKEVIVCFPTKIKNNYKFKSDFFTIKILYINKFSQTEQRIKAIKNCTSKIVLQMDDDLILKKNCIDEMIKCLINKSKKSVIGAILFDNNVDDLFYRYRYKYFYQVLRNFYNHYICLAQPGIKKMGTLSKIGLNYGIDPKFLSKNINCFECEWLNSFIVGHKKSMLRQLKYPYKGKAYGEDVINSIYRKKNGIKHYVALKAKFSIRIDKNKNNLILKFLNFIKILRSKYYILKMLNGSKIRFLIFIPFFFLRCLLCKISNNFK